MTENQYEILALTLRYWFTFLTTYIFWQMAAATLRDIWQGEDEEKGTGNVPFVLVLFSLSAFGLLALRDPSGFHTPTALMGVLIAAIFLFQFYLVYYLFEAVDTQLLLIMDTLALFGFIMLHRLGPELALRQVEWFAAGNILLLLFMFFLPRVKAGSRYIKPMMIGGLAVLITVFIIGETAGGARRWLAVGPYTIQPSEFVKIIYIWVLAYTLQERKTLKQQLPLFLFVVLTILTVVMQRDLGSALHYFLLYIFIYHISTNQWLMTLGALSAGVVGSLVSYRIFAHLRVRVQAWRNPWADVGGGGYQVAQSLIAIGSGGLLGLGLGLGQPYIIPASRTDFIFAAISEEFGVLVSSLIIGFYLLILLRGMSKALRASLPADMLLAAGATISFAVQAFIIIGGVIKLIPLTGITLPFVSYGGSSMMVSLGIMGIIQGITIKNGRDAQSLEDESDEEGEELE